MTRKPEFRVMTYRMLSHTRAQKPTETQISNQHQLVHLPDTCSPSPEEQRLPLPTMICCNPEGELTQQQRHRTRASARRAMHEPGQSSRCCESQLTTNRVIRLPWPPLSPPANVSRPCRRPHRSYSQHLLNPLALAIALVALICVASVAESLLIADTQVNQCPLSECMCKWSNGKKSAQCDHRNLRGLPMQLQSDTQVLDMSGNQLAMLPPRIFQERRLTNLQKLFLSDCKLVHIADESFAQLTNLVELDLSHNNLQQVPTKPLELLKYSLRKLSLAYNKILVIDSAAFSPLSHLNTLDLTRSMVESLRVNAFSGLHELRELKLAENSLTQLPLGAMSVLPENIMIDLYGNPWHCDCELRQSIEWMQRHQIQPALNPTCATPLRHKDIRWQNVKPDDFMCPPVILNKQEEIVVGAGSNVTLACSARGSPPLTFVWFQDEKNMTSQGQGQGGSSAGATSQQPSDPPPSTKLLEERRYEIQEELSPPNITTSILYLMNLKLTDTSVFLCWVQNDAGYSMTNFSLIVDESSPVTGYGSAGGIGAHGVSGPGGSGGLGGLGGALGRLLGVEPGSASNSQILIVVLAFLLLLAATIICLFVLKQVSKERSSKLSGNSDLKSPKQQQQQQHMMMNGKLMGSDKFASMNGGGAPNGRMFATSDDDGATDEDDEDRHSSGSHTSGSQASCSKNNNTRVLADEELDGFIDHLRSGIINMDYHSMSPVIQFNNNQKLQQVVDKKRQDQLLLLQQQQQQQQHHSHHLHHHNHQQLQNHHQLTQLSHLPSASNASSQQAFYGGVQPSNGSNSMATTVSDLSPSSGSASTSFANAVGNPILAPHQQQQQRQYMAAVMMQHQQQQPINHCDYPSSTQQQQQQQHHHHSHNHHQQDMTTNATGASYTSDYQSGYSEDPMVARHQMMPPMYSDMDAAAPPLAAAGYHYNPATLLASSRPSSMNGGPPDVVQNVVFQEMQDGAGGAYPLGNQLHPHQQQQQQFQMHDSHEAPFTHIL